MKKFTTISAVLIALTSCTSSTHKTTVNDSVTKTVTETKTGPTGVSSLCFLNTLGKDSTSIELVIHGNKVSGQMNWLPYQKDSRKGTLEGNIKSDTIHATWSFMQEGMKDTLVLNFLLKDDQLSQKPLKLNTKTGREQTDESAGYGVLYNSSAKLVK